MAKMNLNLALSTVLEEPDLAKPANALALFKDVFPDWLTYQEWIDLEKPDGKKHLFVWQEDVLNSIFNPLIKDSDIRDIQIKVALAGAYGTGKTVLLAIVILMHLHYCYVYDKDREYQGAVFSGSEAQLKQAVWRNVENLAYRRGFKCYKEELVITPQFKILAKTWNKGNIDSIQGIHAENVLVIFDEGTAICTEVFNKAESFSTTARFVWVVTANPTTTVGRFYELFSIPEYQRTWITKNISVYDSFPDGHNYARSIIARYGEDSDEARICIYGQFPLSESSAFFQRYMIDRAIERTYLLDSGSCCLGVDFATGRGKDFDAIAVRTPVEIIEIKKYKMPLDEFMRVVYGYIHRYKPKFVAYDSVGIGELPNLHLIEALRSTRIRAIPISGGSRPLHNFNCCDRRTELLFEMRNWLMDVGKLPNDTELLEEMAGLTYFNTTSGKIRAISKRELEKSPDKVDACIYTFADFIEPIPPDMDKLYKKAVRQLGFAT